MTLGAWIHKKLIENESLTEQLALFNNTPAVFYQDLPKETDEGWESELHYPRIDFETDGHEKTEKSISGQVTLNIWRNSEAFLSRTIEHNVCQAIADRFIELDNREIGILVKRSTEMGQEITAVNGKKLCQKTIVFDLLRFPVQVTSSPDPIGALNYFIQGLDSKIRLFGNETLEDQLINESDNPILYFKLKNIESDRAINSVIWMNAKISVYIFTKTETMRIKYLKYLADELSTVDEVTMLDGSPMFVSKVAVNFKADPLKTGQMEISVQYGILRKAQFSHPLMTANMTSGV